MKLKEYFEELTVDIQQTYEEGITIEQAEKLAAKFLYAQIQVTQELAKTDLDSRMKKSGLKAIKAAVYMDAATKGDKKPTENMLASIIDSSKEVSGEQQIFDQAEVYRDELKNYYDIFGNAHIFYRGISKQGNFNG